MKPERWERIQQLFHRATELPETERAGFLDAECEGDAALQSEVFSLLEADAQQALIDRTLAHVAEGVLESPASPEKVPQDEFGPWRITSILGEGGMGVVYLAERSDLGSKAAIKILRDAWLSPLRRERFAAEQRTLAQLSHPSIATLHDAGTLPEGTPWFVMEYVEGETITTHCTKHDCSIDERLQLFREVCEAVQHAHSHLVIHRDLKPSNILVRQDGSVKLLDFGISKQLDSVDALAEQTRTAVRLMTPAYAAPEQIRGQPVGVHSDIYSLGVILYELLVGRLPFDISGRSAAEAEKILLEREAERPSAAARRMEFVSSKVPRASSIGKSAWSDLDVICLTAMHKDPQRRYRTVDALIRDVDHFLKNEPLEARPDSRRYRLRKFVSRNARVVSISSMAVAGIVVLTGFYTVRMAAARNTAMAEASRAERLQKFTLDLLQGGDEQVGPSDSIRVVTLVDRGVQEAQSLTHEPSTQAAIYETLGNIYMKLGKYPRADSLLRRSLDERRALFGENHADVAQSLVALGELREAQAEYDSAESLITQGLRMAQKTLPRGHPAIAKATVALGQTLEEKGDYDRAIKVLDTAVMLQTASGEPSPELSETLSALANTQFYAGHFAISDSLNRKTLAMDRKIYGGMHPHVADDLMNLGAIQQEFQNYPAAENFYRQALVITRGWYGENHPETASNLTLLGRTLVSEKRYDDAATMLRQAVSIQEKVYGPVHPRVASAVNELGRVAQQQGNLDEAQADFERMVQIYKTVYHDKHYLIGVAESNLAGVYKDRKQYDQSEKLFRDAIRRYTQELSPDHQLMGIAKVRLAETLLADNKKEEAVQNFTAADAILAKQSSPPPQWVERARKGLAAARSQDVIAAR
jgi:serine/threonine protein kinase/tetratricopeptide (TPR) repeat protein